MNNLQKFIKIFVQKSLIFFYQKINKNSLFDLFIWVLKKINLFKANIVIKEKIIYDFGTPFYVARKSRFYLYCVGLEYRLNQLYNEYLLYQIEFNQEDIIIDCGANIGELGFLLHHKHQLKNIIAVEPEKIEFDTLIKNSKYSNYKPINAVLLDKNGEVEFFSDNETADSSIFPDKNLKSTSVQSHTLNKLFLNNKLTNCKLLKLEAEGAEPEILRGGLEILNKIEYISVDCGPERGPNNCITVEEVSRIILNENFHLVDAGGNRKILLFRNNECE